MTRTELERLADGEVTDTLRVKAAKAAHPVPVVLPGQTDIFEQLERDGEETQTAR